jgi:hypothetical protein
VEFFVCSSCARHVKIDETACPFCGEVAGTRVFARRVRHAATRDRTALMFGAAMATALVTASATAAGCGPAQPVAVPAYGAPPVQPNDVSPADAGTNATPPDAAAHPPSPPVAIYGAPPTH